MWPQNVNTRLRAHSSILYHYPSNFDTLFPSCFDFLELFGCPVQDCGFVGFLRDAYAIGEGEDGAEVKFGVLYARRLELEFGFGQVPTALAMMRLTSDGV